MAAIVKDSSLHVGPESRSLEIWKTRLSSKAEWEYACRAGPGAAFSWGASSSAGQANYDANYVYGRGERGEFREGTVPVDSFEANAWGLYQAHGNVWERCADNWHQNYDGAPALHASARRSDKME